VEIAGIPRLIAEVYDPDQNRRPSKPLTVDDAFARCDLTEEMWRIMEMCWGTNPHERPTATDLVHEI
jgi:hypothetical protein